MLVTRPEPEASRTADRLRALGHTVLVEPLLKTEALPVGALPLDGAGALAVTSGRALKIMALHKDFPSLLGLPVYCVGQRCGEIARKLGFTTVITAQGTLAQLTERILEDKPSKTIVYLAARERSGDLQGELARAGVTCEMVEVYSMMQKERFSAQIYEDLRLGKVDAVLFYSFRTAETFMRLIHLENDTECLNSMKAFTVSERSRSLLNAFGHVEVSEEPNEDSLFDLTLRKRVL
nr:uroporphyrinogen-III synthase [Pseudovibrio flavus]